MGNRITRAASHLPADEVQRRIQEEERLWRRQRWEIIYQALTAPRQAEDIAKTVGVSVATVHRVISTYKQGGVAAIETPGKGGRRHQYLTLEQARTLLQPFLVRAARGEMTTAEEIKLASARPDWPCGQQKHLVSPLGPTWLAAPWCCFQSCSRAGEPARTKGRGSCAGAPGAAILPSLRKSGASTSALP